MQQVAGLSNDVLIEFFKTGIPGIALVLGAVGTLIGTIISAWKGVANNRLNKQIARDVDGRFSEMLGVIAKLTDRMDMAERHASAEREARLTGEKRMVLALSVISARTGHPFTDIEALIRAEDLGRPPRRPAGTVPRRRKNSGEVS